MYYVYIVKSKTTERYYVGYTRDIGERLKCHNSGKTKSLRKHIPLEIIKVEEYDTYAEARARERQIKRYKSGEAFRKLLNC
jgi:putative endonuclease